MITVDKMEKNGGGTVFGFTKAITP